MGDEGSARRVVVPYEGCGGGPMYLGHGFRPYGHSIGGTQQRAAWEPGVSLSRDAELGQDGFLVGAHEGFLGALVQVVIAQEVQDGVDHEIRQLPAV